MYRLHWLTWIALKFLSGICTTEHSCLRVSRDSELVDPPFVDHRDLPLPARAVQAIIPSYKFYCDCVNITSWEAYLRQGKFNCDCDITFQVWRPSPTAMNDGCYSLVGQNVFTSVTFNSERYVSLSPVTSSIISARSGDVVGYYTISRHGNNGIQLERDSSYSENIIWYQELSSNILPPVQNNTCIVGSDMSVQWMSTNAAPRLQISTISCILPTSISSLLSSSSLQGGTSLFSSASALADKGTSFFISTSALEEKVTSLFSSTSALEEEKTSIFGSISVLGEEGTSLLSSTSALEKTTVSTTSPNLATDHVVEKINNTMQPQRSSADTTMIALGASVAAVVILVTLALILIIITVVRAKRKSTSHQEIINEITMNYVKADHVISAGTKENPAYGKIQCATTEADCRLLDTNVNEAYNVIGDSQMKEENNDYGYI